MQQSVTLVSSEIGSSGGIERVFLELILFFSHHGYRVNVVCRSIDASLVKHLHRLEIVEVDRGESLASRVFYTALWMYYATRALQRLGKDRGVVIGPPCSGFQLDIVMAGSCHLAARLEMQKDGRWVWLLNPMNWLIVGSECYAFRRVDSTIMVPSNRTASEISRLYKVPINRIQVIPHGVDLSVFRPVESAREKEQLRKRNGFLGNQFVLLSIVNELEMKGCYLVLDALSLLREKGYTVHYVIAGRADYKNYSEQVKKKDLTDFVSLLPSTSGQDLVRLYQSADVFILPTKYESFGLVCMEALACGLPVIACAVGGVEDYVESGSDGWLVARRVDAIREAVECAINCNSYQQMAVRARNKARAYEWNHVLKPLLGIVERYHSTT